VRLGAVQRPRSDAFGCSPAFLDRSSSSDPHDDAASVAVEHDDRVFRVCATSGLVAGLLLVSSCSEPEAQPTAPEARTVAAVDPCATLVGAKFESVELLDGGLGPDGNPALGHLHLEVSADQVRYQETDYFRLVTYVCRNGEIFESGHYGPPLGRYDAERGILIWLGREYRRRP
jgi:hypothetical protein